MQNCTVLLIKLEIGYLGYAAMIVKCNNNITVVRASQIDLNGDCCYVYRLHKLKYVLFTLGLTTDNNLGTKFFNYLPQTIIVT